MDERIKLQIENIAELCNHSNKKTLLGKNVADGKIFDVALQFYKLRE